jgi:hypothetical protein
VSVETLPLPPGRRLPDRVGLPHREDHPGFDGNRLHAQGRQGRTESDAVVDVSALEREIDELVYALYGLRPEEVKLVEGAAK